MPRESGRPRARRLAFLGLLLLILPAAEKNQSGPACGTDNALISLICTPVGLVRMLVPLARLLLADIRTAR